MASFDFIDAAAKGYEKFWTHKSYFLRVAIPLIFLKVGCLLAVFVLQLEESFLRQGLVLLPSYTLEALFVIGIVRFLMYREPIYIWGKPVPAPSQKDEGSDRALTIFHGPLPPKQSIKAAIALYLLLRVIGTAFAAFVMDLSLTTETAEGAESSGLVHPVLAGAMLFGMLALFIWGLRLVWLYVPVAMGIPPMDFLKHVKGGQISISFLGAWLICYLPLIVTLGFLMQFFLSLLVEGTAAYVVSQAVMTAVIETIMISVQVIAMTYGVHELYAGKPKTQ